MYNLKKVGDFPGSYTAVSAGGAVGGGKGITTMRNASGVRITLHFNLSGRAGDRRA